MTPTRSILYASVIVLLAILAGFFVTAQGQELSDRVTYDIGEVIYFFADSGYTHRTVVYGDTVRTSNPYGWAGMAELIRQWREYRAWCYADSILIATSMTWEGDGRWVRKNDVYTHNHYPSFGEFIDWLSRREQ
jgi:hypothetical protein